jgi:hypothetical protein
LFVRIQIGDNHVYRGAHIPKIHVYLLYQLAPFFYTSFQNEKVIVTSPSDIPSCVRTKQNNPIGFSYLDDYPYRLLQWISLSHLTFPHGVDKG